MNAGQIPRQPIYIGGLGRVFTEIYDQKAHLTDRQLPDLTLSKELQLIVLEKEELDTIKLSGGRIFVLTAGMLTECTPAHDLALRMIGDERQAIFFVGYADPGHSRRTAQSVQAGRDLHLQRRRRRSHPALRSAGIRPDGPRQPRGAAGFCLRGFARAPFCWATARPIPGNGSKTKSAPAIRRSRSSSPPRDWLWTAYNSQLSIRRVLPIKTASAICGFPGEHSGRFQRFWIKEFDVIHTRFRLRGNHAPQLLLSALTPARAQFATCALACLKREPKNGRLPPLRFREVFVSGTHRQPVRFANGRGNDDSQWEIQVANHSRYDRSLLKVLRAKNRHCRKHHVEQLGHDSRHTAEMRRDADVPSMPRASFSSTT